MPEQYRQKLINWLSTISLITLVSIIPAVYFWISQLPVIQNELGWSNYTQLILIAESIITYAIYSPIFLTWHFFDFIEPHISNPSYARRFLKYRSFCLILAPSLVLILLMNLHIWSYNSCDANNEILYFKCIVGPSRWLLYPWLALMLLMILVAILKVANSAFYLLRRSK